MLNNNSNIKINFLLRLDPFQKPKIILSKGYANALPVVVIDAVP
jgi:hypothetical protein